MKKIYYILLAVLMFGSCETMNEPTIETNPTYPISGEWWVTYKLADGTDIGGGYSQLLTFNTASNKADSVWVSDEGHFWTFKVKSGININERTFTAQHTRSIATSNGDPYPILVNILNGKVIPKGGKTKGGNVSDSIYFEVQFEDDDPSFGTSYIVSGVRRTGFVEDEY